MSDVKRGIKVFSALCLTLIFVSSASGNVLIDSQDWKDVYTGMYTTYENWDRGEPYFLKDASASNVLSGNILPAGNITLIESTDEPFSGGMDSRLTSQPENYNIQEIIEVESAQRDLIPDGQESFIVVPSSYPSAAVVAAPLARAMDSWVLMVNEDNVDNVSQIIQEAEGETLMVGSFTNDIESDLEGRVDEEILTSNPQNLSIQVAERFREEQEFEELMLTPARELSTDLFMTERPVLVTKSGPPISDEIVEYIGETESIQSLFLANPEYSVVGSSINDRVESNYDRSISVMVHFGQARGDQSSIYAPSLFPLPSSNLDLQVNSVIYNPADEQALVEFYNPGEAQIFEMTESLNVLSDGDSVDTAFDESSVLIGPESTRTVAYDIDLTSDQLETNLTASMTTTYGTNSENRRETLTNSGEFRPPYETGLTVQNITDRSNITLSSVKYMTNLDRFKVELENTGSVASYATVNLREITVQGQESSFSSTSGEIGSGETETVYVTPNPALDRIDLEENEEISVVLNYGESEESKLKQVSSQVDFQTGSGIPVVGQFGAAPTAGGVLVLVLILAVVAEVRYGKLTEVASRAR